MVIRGDWLKGRMYNSGQFSALKSNPGWGQSILGLHPNLQTSLPYSIVLYIKIVSPSRQIVPEGHTSSGGDFEVRIHWTHYYPMRPQEWGDEAHDMQRNVVCPHRFMLYIEHTLYNESQNNYLFKRSTNSEHNKECGYICINKIVKNKCTMTFY